MDCSPTVDQTLAHHGMVAILIASLTLGGVFDAGAHDNATGVVKERMDSMQGMSRAGKVLSAIVKGKRDFDSQEAHELSLRLQSHASRIAELFPSTQHSREGSGTEASPAIWERWAKFEELAQQLTDSSANLVKAAEVGDEAKFRNHFTSLTQSCRTCHKSFRRKKR